MAELTIGQVAQRLGIKPSTIRYYESEGLIPRAPRRSGRRCYDAGIFDYLVFIRFALRAGFHIGEIKPLVRGLSRSSTPGEHWRAVAEQKMMDLDRQIGALQSKKQVLHELVKCKCASLAHFASDHLRTIAARQPRT